LEGPSGVQSLTSGEESDVARRRFAVVLLAAAVVGGAGGFGAGVLTDRDGSGASGSQTPVGRSSSPVAVKTPIPDPAAALRADDLIYQTKKFIAEQAVRSKVSVQVPTSWGFTQPREDQGRYTDPTRKRWVRVEAGFLPTQTPAAWAQVRATQLQENGDPVQDLRIVDQRSGTATHVDGSELHYTTLIYTYIPQTSIRYVMVRWIAFDDQVSASVEISVVGLPQDREALTAVLQRATRTVDRADSRR
jgi:hypothetical protein